MLPTEREWKQKQLETYKARVIELQSVIEQKVNEANRELAVLTGAMNENKRLAEELEKELNPDTLPPDNKDT